MTRSDDAGLRAALAHFGVTAEPLGSGGEATVYPLGDDLVLRIAHAGSSLESLHERVELLTTFDRRAVRFALPETLEVHTVATRHLAVERRLPGRPVQEVLPSLDRPDRDRLIVGVLDAFEALPDVRSVHPAGVGVVGDIIGPFVHHTTATSSWLVQRVARSLERADPDFASVDPAALTDGLPTDGPVGLCHLDGCAPNVLSTGTAVTAIIDFGPTTAIADRRLDALATAAYFRIDTLRGALAPTDHPVVDDWLRRRGLLGALPAMERWLAGYWSWVGDEEPELDEWCRRTLLEER